VPSSEYVYGIVADNGTNRACQTEIKLNTGYAATSETVTNLLDLIGRGYKTVYPDGSSAWSAYNDLGQLIQSVDPDGVTTLYLYNGKGEQVDKATDLNGSVLRVV